MRRIMESSFGNTPMTFERRFKLLIQTFYLVGCPEVLVKVSREYHDCHRSFKPFIQAGHGFLSDIFIISNDLVTALAGSLDSFAVEHILKFAGQSLLVSGWGLLGDVP